jgi:hypothetical protein
VRERWDGLAVDEEGALEEATEALLERVFGPAWERLGPLSAGAVASSVAIVAARGLLRRVFGRRYGKYLSWAGAVVLVPVALWLFGGEDAKNGGRENIDGGREIADPAE